jgi:hypothetical protein
VFAPLVDQRRDFATLEIIKTASHERETISRQILDGERKVQFAIKPGFHGVLSGGDHVHQVVSFKRSHMAGEDFGSNLLVTRSCMKTRGQLPTADGDQCQ